MKATFFLKHAAQSPGCIRSLDGQAGTGKTSCALEACNEIWERHGYRVIEAAPSAAGVRVAQFVRDDQSTPF